LLSEIKFILGITINRFIIKPKEIINESRIDQWSFNINEEINANDPIKRPKIKFFGKIFLRNADLLFLSNILFETGVTHTVKNNI
jgi:hypothetical protein